MKAHLVQAIFLCLNLCSLFSACGSGSFAPGIGNASLSSSSLQSIQVAPPQPSIIMGQDQQFTAIGLYHDGSSKDITSSVVWASSNTSVAKISGSGFAKSGTMGSATISATLSGVTGDSTLTVTKAILESINIAPANPVLLLGTIQQFTATGTFSDQSQHDITSSVSWVSSNHSLASISGGGLAAALALGSLTISASSGSVSASTTVNVQAAVLSSITIHPGNGKVAKWTSQQFNATGTYTDGTTHGVTGQVSWTSSNTAVAKMAKSGLASALTPGTTTITATLGSISASATLKVTNATIVSISVRPSGRTIAPVTTLSFTAVGLFSDNSTQVINRESTWASDNPRVAGMRAGSTFIAVAPGTANISATFFGVSGWAPLNVSSVTLSSISVTQATAVLAPTTSVNCVATGTFSDGSTQVITNVVKWTSSEPTVASVSNGGKVTANSGGSATITAQFASVYGDSTITVDPSPVALILISPPTTSIPQQTGVAFQAIATFADGNTQDLTAFAFWTSSLPSVATIDTGHATGLESGTAIITALFDGQVGTASLTVTGATPTSQVVSPSAISSEQEH